MVDGAGHDNTREPGEQEVGSDCGQSQVSKAGSASLIEALRRRVAWPMEKRPEHFKHRHKHTWVDGGMVNREYLVDICATCGAERRYEMAADGR